MSLSYKIKLVHLLCRPEQQREKRSVACLTPLQDHGINYVAHVNEPYVGKPPVDTCRRPEAVTETLGKPGQLWCGHYGAWLAWKRAVETEFGDDLDFLMICECDCILLVDTQSFVSDVVEACAYMLANDIAYLSFGNTDTKEADKSDGKYTVVPNIFKSHCVIFPRSAKEHMIECYKTHPWDNDDYWKNWIFRGRKIAITNKTIAVQLGQSLIDEVFDRPKIDLIKTI